MGELQADAYLQEFGWRDIAIVRPANVYGPHDYFDASSSMVIPSLVRRAVAGETPFIVWGDGSQKRGFLHVDDMCYFLISMLEEEYDAEYDAEYDICSSIIVSISELIDELMRFSGKFVEVKYDASYMKYYCQHPTQLS